MINDMFVYLWAISSAVDKIVFMSASIVFTQPSRPNYEPLGDFKGVLKIIKFPSLEDLRYSNSDC